MPQYSDGNPPPARTREEVSRLLAGAAKPESITKNISSSSLRLVLVAGPKDHNKGEHDYPAWQKVWSRLLKLAPDTMVDTAWEFPSSQQIDQADVLGTA